MTVTCLLGRRILPCLALAALPGSAGAQEAAQRAAPNHSAHGAPASSAPADLPRALPQPMAASTRPAAPGGATASVPALALSDFERMAMERNPTLQLAAAQFDAARSRSFQAGLYPNPIVGYTSEQIGTPSEAAGSGTFTRNRTPGELQGGFVQQEFVMGGKLRLSRAKFAEEANAARWQAEAQRLRVLNGVRIRYYEVLAAQRLVEVAKKLVEINNDAVRTTSQLVNVGQANVADLYQARLEARRAGVDLQNAQKLYRGDWEKLVALVGAPELRPVWLDARPLEAESPPLDMEATLANLLRSSPEIQAAAAEIRRDHIMVQRERAEPIPNITIQTVVGRNYEFNITTAGVQASIPLPIWNRNQGTVHEAQSDLARSYAEYRRVELSLRDRLADAYARYENAVWSTHESTSVARPVNDLQQPRGGNALVLGEEAGSLQLAQRAYEIQLANFRAHRAAWPQVLVAQRTYYDLYRDYIQSRLEQRRVEVEINGMLLVDGLSPPGSPTPQGHIESVAQPR